MARIPTLPIDVTNIDFSRLDAAKTVDSVTSALRDGAYITIGLGVIGARTAAEVATTTTAKVQEITRQYATKVQDATQQYGSKLQTANRQYGNKVQAATKQARTAAEAATKQVKGIVRSAA